MTSTVFISARQSADQSLLRAFSSTPAARRPASPGVASSISFRSATGSRPLVSGHRSAPNVCPVLALPGTVVSYSLIRIVSLGPYRAVGRVRPFEADQGFVVVQVAAQESSRARGRAHQLAQRGNRSVVQIRRLGPDAVQHVRLVAVGALRHAPGRVAEVLVESRLPVALRHAPVGARLSLVVQAVDACRPPSPARPVRSGTRWCSPSCDSDRRQVSRPGRSSGCAACGTWRSSP